MIDNQELLIRAPVEAELTITYRPLAMIAQRSITLAARDIVNAPMQCKGVDKAAPLQQSEQPPYAAAVGTCRMHDLRKG